MTLKIHTSTKIIMISCYRYNKECRSKPKHLTSFTILLIFSLDFTKHVYTNVYNKMSRQLHVKIFQHATKNKHLDKLKGLN